MNTLKKSWDEFWFSRFDPISVSIYRISLGILMFIYYIANFPNWERFYAANGIASLNLEDLRATNWWSIFSYTEGIIPIKVYWYIGFFSTIAFTIGFQTRFVTILLYVLQTSMNCRDWFVINGEDHIFRMALFYSCFAPLNFCLSVDSWLKRKSFGKSKSLREAESPSIWPIRAFQINILLIYLVNVPNKLTDDIAWLNGEAIYWTMANNMWSHGTLSMLFANYDCLLSKIATYGTIFVEGAFPFLVWFEKTKLFIIIAIASLHVGIAIFLTNVTFFTLSMVCAFWVFVPPQVTHNVFSRILILTKKV